MNDLLIPLIAVGLAELGDKTQLSILLLSSKTTKYFQLFLGVILAFFIVDGSAILLGSYITNIIPISFIKTISAILFIFFGFMTLQTKKKKSEVDINLKNPFITGFSFIFISEMGDKTQIASALFAAKYNWFLVLVGVMIALMLLTAAAIYFGKLIADRINKNTLNKIAGTIFLLVGIIILLGI